MHWTRTNLVRRKISSVTVRCPRATIASRLFTDTPISPKIFFLVRKLNCAIGDERCRTNVEFGPSACRCQRCWTGTKRPQVDIGGLRAELRINYGWSSEKINLKLREL